MHFKSSVVCKPEREIESAISSGYIGLNYVDSLLDLEDYDTPVKKIFYTPYTRASKNLLKEYHIYVKNGVIKTDKGWIYPNKEEKSFYSISREKEILTPIEESQLFSENSTIFASFTLRIDHLQKTWERRYEKIQDVISNTG